MKTDRETTTFDKELLKNLAEDANIKMINNKILQETIKIYNRQADTIKYLMANYSRNLKSYSKTKTLKDIEDYNLQLNHLINKIKNKIKKLILKNKTITTKLFENLSIDLETLTKIKEDNFILKNAVKEKTDTLLTLKKISESIQDSNEIKIIRKYEIEVNQRASIYYLDRMNFSLQQRLLFYSRAFNSHINRNKLFIKKINELKKEIEFLKKYIELLEFLPKKDIDNSKITNKINILNKLNNNPQINISFQGIIINNNFYPPQISQSQTKNKASTYKSTKNINRINIDDENYKDIIAEKNKKHSKINLIKIDELLSISNIICENEDLIDAELHSDDEVVFEKKVVSNKTIIKDYSSKINKSIPKLYLNQIEFNKLRVMDECDLYSLRKRKNKAGDIYEVLEVTKDEIQKYKEKKKLNKKKLKAIKSYIDELKNDYKLLKNIKLTSSICMPQQIPDLEEISNSNEIKIKKSQENRENNRYNYMDMDSDDQENIEVYSVEEENEMEDEDNVIIDIESENEDKEMKLHSYKSQRNVAKLDNKYKNFIKTGKSTRPMMDKNEEIKNSRCKLSSFRPKSK